MAEMKVHLYRVLGHQGAPDVTQVLAEIANTPLQDRMRLISQKELRAEAVVAPNTRGNNSRFWLCDFTRLRFDHGPGRVSPDDPIEGFDLEADQGFGEETAALYDPATGYMLIQYNHFGVRPGGIQQYLSLFNPNAVRVYELRVRLDETADVRLATKQVLKKIAFKVDATKLTAAQRRAGVGLVRALDMNDTLQGQTIEVTISSGRGSDRALNFNSARRLIDDLRDLVFAGALQDDKIVKSFEVWGKETVADSTEAIDMLTPKVEQNLDGIVVGADRRYTLQSRWEALVRARNGWNTLIAGR